MIFWWFDVQSCSHGASGNRFGQDRTLAAHIQTDMHVAVLQNEKLRGNKLAHYFNKNMLANT